MDYAHLPWNRHRRSWAFKIVWRSPPTQLAKKINWGEDFTYFYFNTFDLQNPSSPDRNSKVPSISQCEEIVSKAGQTTDGVTWGWWLPFCIVEQGGFYGQKTVWSVIDSDMLLFVEVAPFRQPLMTKKPWDRPFQLVEKFEKQWHVQNDQRGCGFKEELAYCARWAVLWSHWLSKDHAAFCREIVEGVWEGSEKPSVDEIIQKLRTIRPLVKSCLEDLGIYCQEVFVHREEHRRIKSLPQRGRKRKGKERMEENRKQHRRFSISSL